MMIGRRDALPARTIAKMVKTGEIVYDLFFQRNDVWTSEQRSELGISMIEGVMIPAVCANRVTVGDKVYKIIDGRQRIHTIEMILDGTFVFAKRSIVRDEYGNEVMDISGMTYDDLPEDMQDTIRDCAINIEYYEDMTDEQAIKWFDRLNNGTALSGYQKARSECPVIKQLIELSKHELFEESMTKKARNDMKNELSVAKAYIMLTDPKPNLELKYVEEMLSTMILDEEEMTDLVNVLNKIYDAYKIIKKDKRDASLNKKIARRIATVGNFTSIIPMTYANIDVDMNNYVEFLQWFFGGEGKEISKSQKYNLHCKGSHRVDVEIRTSEVNKYWENFIKERKIK